MTKHDETWQAITNRKHQSVEFSQTTTHLHLTIFEGELVDNVHSRPVKNIIFWGVHHKRPIVPSIGPIEWPNEGGHNFLYLASL